jgi:signal transduction histidine kinase
MALAQTALEHERLLEVLQGICHAFASATSLPEVSSSLSRWTRTAVGSNSVTTRLFLPDRSGQLRAVFTDGLETNGGIVELSPGRRKAFETKRSQETSTRAQVRSLDLPLVSRGRCLGVLEITGPEELIQTARPALEAVAAQGGIALHHIKERRRLVDEVDASARTLRFVGAIADAASPREAVEAMVAYCWEASRSPVAAWAPSSGDPWHRLTLTAHRGLSEQEIRQLDRSVIVPGASRNRARQVRRFARICGIPHATDLAAGDAVLFLGHDGVPDRHLRSLLSVLEKSLRHFRETQLTEIRAERQESGIALTAHELRGPLLSATAVIDVLADGAGDETLRRHLLDATQLGLRDLASLVDELLRWTSPGVRLSLDSTDLGALVEEARTTLGETLADRVLVGDSYGVRVKVDVGSIISSIRYVIAHSLRHSPTDTMVEIEMKRGPHSASIGIIDRGPPLSDARAKLLFDPFARDSGISRDDRTLELFIARRIIEAHGGTIGVDSRKGRTRFELTIPSA